MSAEVVASVAWYCPECRANATLHLGHSVDVLGLMGRIKQLHRETSPECTAECPSFEQVETPPDATVNDPRERSANPAVDQAIHEPRPRRRNPILAGMLAAAAMLAPDDSRQMGVAHRIDRAPELADAKLAPEVPQSRLPDYDSVRRVSAAQQKRQRKAHRRKEFRRRGGAS